MSEIERIDNYINGEITSKPLIKIIIKDVDDPASVLDKAKEIMKIIADYASPKRWPADREWKDILPAWFVHSMTDKTPDDRDNDEYLWHFESWIESMYHRAWMWYSSKIENRRIVIILETLNIPYVSEQFLYIFYSQGISMNQFDIWDSVYDE